MKPLSAGKVAHILKEHGFVLSRQKGSHAIWKHPETGTVVPVPLHGESNPIPIGTFLAIVKQSKIPRKEFNQKR